MRAFVATVVLATLIAGQRAAAAQDFDQVKLEFTRPDGEKDDAQGRVWPESQAAPPRERILRCGSFDIALVKTTYDLPVFSYSFLVKRLDSSTWRLATARKPDKGRFQASTVNDVKVFLSNVAGGEPDCDNFELPVFCIKLCSDVWWELSGKSQEPKVVYLGGTGFLELLFKRRVQFPIRIANPSLRIDPPDYWSTDVRNGSRGDSEWTLDINITPRWKLWQDVLFRQSGSTARLTYETEVTHPDTEGIQLPGDFDLPVVVKPAPWLMLFPILAGTAAGLWVRRLSGRRIRYPLREWLLADAVAIVTLMISYAINASVTISVGKISSEGLVGALLLGLASGIAGQEALEALRERLGIPIAKKSVGA